jgi:hypothetical protein
MHAISGSIPASRPTHLHFETILRSRSTPAVLVAVAMFLLDVRTPNGLLDGFPYVIAVLLCCSIPNVRAAPLLSLGLMPALYFGYTLSPMGAPTWIAVTNRVVAAALIWLVALYVRHTVSSRLNQNLELSRREAQLRHQQDVSRRLRDDVALELQMMEWRLNRLQRCADAPDLRSESLMLRRALARARQSVLTEAARLGA